MNQLVKNFNNLVKKTIFKVQNKTNNKLLLFKAQIKTKNKLSISKFNKYLITLISLLFFYLFYLSIPVLYDKNWVQKKIENELLKNFKIYFSLSSDISYRILPSPHYLIKDSKILKKDNKTISLAKIKTLKVFISQKNFFDKNKMSLKNIKIDNADFTLLKGDLRLLKDSTNSKFSKKKIKISKSNIFFKDSSDTMISIIKISEAFLFQDGENLLKLKGEVFNIPFNFNYSKWFDPSNKEEIHVVAKKIKLDIFNTHNYEGNNAIQGKNIISILNNKIHTNYKIENDVLIFDSTESRIKNSKIDYSGELSIKPFDLKVNIDLENYNLRSFFNPYSFLNELIKTELLFNKNISINTSTTNTNLRNKIFQDIKINFNIIDGKLNINKTRLVNKKIGSLKLEDSNLSFESNKLILNTDIIINIKNSQNFFSLLQTNKKFRKPIKDILINLDYDFLSNEIKFNNIKIDNQEINGEMLRVIEGFNDNASNNMNKSKRLLNAFFEIYNG